MEKVVFTRADIERMLPPIGFPLQLGPYVFRVTYRNIGQFRFSAELVAVVREKAGTAIVVLADGTQLTMDEWDAYRRKLYLDPSETGRNPANVTLKVQSGTLAAKDKL